MTSKELRFDLLTEITHIVESDDMMKEAIASLRQIRQEVAAKAQSSTVSLRRLKARTVKARKVDDADEDREPTQEEILAGIKEGLREAKLAREGKIKLQDAREWLNGL